MSTVRTTDPVTPSWTANHTIGVLVLSMLLLLVAVTQVPSPTPRLVHFPGFVATLAGYPTLCAWAIDLVLMAGIASIISNGLTRSARGLFIDDRNRISLSRFQVVLWTFMILSALCAAGVGNALAGDPDPLGIKIPTTVWSQLGISAVSLVSTSLILSGKRIGTPPAAAASPLMPSSVGGVAVPARSWRERLKAQGVETAGLNVQGSAVVRDDIASASWGDLFRGDDMASFESLDLAKLQVFFLTTLLTFCYSIGLGTNFIQVDRARAPVASSGVVGIKPKPVPSPDPRRVNEFPPFDPSILALLGISNAGYLASKAITRPNPST